MATRTVISRIQTKRDTAVNWESNNPVLLNGEEIIVDTNAGEIRKKIGDGTKTYTQLPFTDETLRNLISNKVDKVSGKGLSTNDFTNTLLTKLNGIEEGANKYTHPSSHAASMITQDSTHRFVTDTEKSTWNAKASTAVATTSTNGLMSKADKSKLDGIAANANNYVHPSSHAATMITEDTTHRFVTDTQISTWDGKASTAVATTTTDGLMSKNDKSKLDGIATGANKTTVDSALSSTSTNPVQNKVINTALSGKADSSHTHTKSEITDFPTSLKNPTALTIQFNGTSQGAYDGSTAKTVNITPSSIGASPSSHTHTASDVGADPQGSAATALTNAKSYTDTKISDLINGAPTTLDTLGEIAEAMADNADVVQALQESIGTKANASDLTSHTGNTTVHITANERTAWNAKASTAVATTSTNGLMSKADKSKLDGIATGANNYTHPSSHAATMITEDTTHRFVTDAEKSTWNGKASTAVATTSANGLMSSDDKTKLDGIAVGANNYTHPSSHAATMITQDATHRFVTDTEKSTWNAKASTAVATTSANGLMSKADKSKLDGIAANANNYSHPTYTSKTSGLYKITVDGTGHVSATTAVAKADITGLGIPAQDTTYSAATTSAPGLMSAADKKKLDGIATGATKVTVDSALSSTSTNPVQNKIINSSLDALTSRVSTLETNYNTLLAKVKTAVFWE